MRKTFEEVDREIQESKANSKRIQTDVDYAKEHLSEAPCNMHLLIEEFKNKIEQQEIQIKSLVEALGQYVDKLRQMDERINRLEDKKD